MAWNRAALVLLVLLSNTLSHTYMYEHIPSAHSWLIHVCTYVRIHTQLSNRGLYTHTQLSNRGLYIYTHAWAHKKSHSDLQWKRAHRVLISHKPISAYCVVFFRRKNVYQILFSANLCIFWRAFWPSFSIIYTEGLLNIIQHHVHWKRARWHTQYCF